MNFADIINKQREYFNSNETKDVRFRITQLKKLRSLLHQNEPAFYEAIYKDFKKSEFDTYSTELGFVYHEIDEAIKKLPAWSKRKRAKTNLINIPGRSYIIPEPLGVCLVIGAWNYPYMLSLIPLVSAMAAGNTIVLKPSEIPASTSAVMAKLVNENFPPEYMFVVEGSVAETTELLNQKFDKIFFTGSTAVGKIVYQAAAKNLTPVTLELGGKSPAIVTKNSNIRNTAKRIVWAKYLNAGQTCVAPDFVLVDETVKEELLSCLKDYIIKSEYSFAINNYTQIINEKNFNRLLGLMENNKIYFGGESDLQSRYLAPTILTDLTFEDKIMTEEIFGPLLPVLSYSNLDEAIAKVKSRPSPLSCYIFSGDDVTKNKLLRELSFGGGAVNDLMMQLSNHYLPFGGVGESGMGNYHGKAGFDAFTHYKSIFEKPFGLEPNLKFSPYSKRKLEWLKWLMKK